VQVLQVQQGAGLEDDGTGGFVLSSPPATAKTSATQACGWKKSDASCPEKAGVGPILVENGIEQQACSTTFQATH
jgi:hypothetical protein